LENKNVDLGIAIAAWTFALISIVLTFCFCHKIKVAIAILKTASLFVGENCGIVLVPMFIFIIFVGYLIYWVIVGVYLYSSGTVVHKPDSLPFSQFHHNKTVEALGIIHIIALFWILAFIIACGEFAICAGAANWYFKKSHPVMNGIKSLFRYHLGTVAFGSFILALVWAIQVLLEFISMKAKESGADHNIAVSFLLKCCECYLSCFERFIKFLNKSAYTVCVMTGKSFCESCKESFFLMLRYASRFAVAGGIGDLFVMIGRLFISACVAVIGYLIITHTTKYHVPNPVVPTFVFYLIIIYFLSSKVDLAS
jgi:hypothetical protein